MPSERLRSGGTRRLGTGRRRLGALLAVAMAALLTGCAGIPDSGAVRVGRQISAGGALDDVDVRVLPPGPVPGMTPVDLVRGFLRAMVNGDSDYEIARSYLSRHAAASWNPLAGVTTYDDGGVTIADAGGTDGRRTVRVAAPRVGRIDARGDFTPRDGTLRTAFGLTRQNGQWRIDRLADGTLLSVSDALRSYRLADLYYFNPAGTTLVPEQVLLQPEPAGAATALVRALLSGPGKWLQPSVRPAAPAGTSLLGNVPVDGAGTAEVNLSAAIRHATRAGLAALSAQLSWTLRQVGGITAVRLLVDGSPLPVPGLPAAVPLSHWAGLSPAAPPALPTAFYLAGGRWRGVSGSISGLEAAAGLSELAMSDSGSLLAGLQITNRATELLMGRRGSVLRRVMGADTLTRPSFTGSGDVVTVATRGARRWVAELSPQGAATSVAAPAMLLGRPVQDLQISRDGARVAAVVGSVGRGRLLVGRVEAGRAGARLAGFRTLLPRAADVRGVAWEAPDQLVVTAADASGGRELILVDVDGYSTRTVSTVGLAGNPVEVAAAPGRPLLVTVGGSVWTDDAAGGWRRVGPGSHPGYAD